MIEVEKVYLNAVRTEGLYVAVVDEIDAVHVDDAQVGRGRFELVDVDDFVDLLLFFADHFISAWNVSRVVG